MESTGTTEFKDYTKQDVQEFLAQISEKVVKNPGSYFHCMLALNSLLRLSNAAEIFDQNLKEQAKDLWVKLKSTGLHLTDPPLLFGIPQGQVDGRASSVTGQPGENQNGKENKKGKNKDHQDTASR